MLSCFFLDAVLHQQRKHHIFQDSLFLTILNWHSMLLGRIRNMDRWLDNGWGHLQTFPLNILTKGDEGPETISHWSSARMYIFSLHKHRRMIYQTTPTPKQLGPSDLTRKLRTSIGHRSQLADCRPRTKFAKLCRRPNRAQAVVVSSYCTACKDASWLFLCTLEQHYVALHSNEDRCVREDPM